MEDKKKAGFFKILGRAFNPFKYDETTEQIHGWSIFRYFLLLILFGFLICTVLFIPVLYSDVQSQMNNFKQLEVSVNDSMRAPVYLPKANPLVTIDTRAKPVPPSGEPLLMTEEDFFVKKPFFMGTEKIDSSDFKDLLNNQGMVTVFILLMLPSLLLLFFLYYISKTLLVLLLVSIISIVITRIAKFDISMANTLKVALLAATPMIILDFLRYPFGLFLFWGQWILFLLFFIIGVVRTGDFDNGSRHKGHKRSRKYR